MSVIKSARVVLETYCKISEWYDGNAGMWYAMASYKSYGRVGVYSLVAELHALSIDKLYEQLNNRMYNTVCELETEDSK